jgi:hypothetical protein
VFDLGGLKAQGTWLIVIENSDFADAVDVLKFCVAIKQFNKEIFIGLVAIVIHNGDVDVLTFLSRFEL